MTRKEAVEVIVSGILMEMQECQRFNDCEKDCWECGDYEAYSMALDALKSDMEEHDGCKGCRYEANDEYMMPCANCRQNYMDRWTPMPKKQDWIPCSERLPETPKHYYDRSLYLTCTKTGYITSIYWWDGWNCSLDEDGTVYREHEMKDIVAWMELPEPYKDGEIK